MLSLKTDVETLVQHISKGLKEELEAALYRALLQQAQSTIKAIAKEMAESLHGRLDYQRNSLEDKTIVMLSLNGVREIVVPPPEA